MKMLFTFLIILLIAALIGLAAYQDNGYVLIGRGVTTIEMSLALFIFLQISLYLLIAFTLHFIKRTWSLPDYIKQHHNRSKILRARNTSKQGLIALAQGHWKKAEKSLLKHVDNSETPLLNYLSAARAAQKLNEPERRDRYLSLAYTSMPEADFAVKLTQAELQLAHGQLEQSLAILIHLKSISPKHSHVLNLLAQLYEKLKSWKDLQTLLPELKKHKVLKPKELRRLEKNVYKQLLDNTNNSKAELDTLWKSFPKEFHTDNELVIVYVQRLIQQEEIDKAEALLKIAIKNKWNIEAIYLYGLIKTNQPQAQLDFAEAFLKQHEKNSTLLLTLGRLCTHLELWGKAQAYFEASLGAEERVETYKELALLVEQLGDTAKANEYFKQGCLLSKNKIF